MSLLMKAATRRTPNGFRERLEAWDTTLGWYLRTTRADGASLGRYVSKWERVESAFRVFAYYGALTDARRRRTPLPPHTLRSAT